MSAHARQGSEDLTEKVFRFGNEVVYICVLSALWLIASLPLVTVGAATVGVYACLISHLKDGNRQYVRPFWQGFTKSLKPAILPTFLLIALVGLTGFNTYYYLVTQHNVTGYVLCAVQGLLCLTGCVLVTYYVAGLGRYYAADLSGRLPTIRDGYGEAVSSPWKSVLVALVTLGVPGFFVFTSLWQFAVFGIGIICYVNTRILLWKGRDS